MTYTNPQRALVNYCYATGRFSWRVRLTGVDFFTLLHRVCKQAYLHHIILSLNNNAEQYVRKFYRPKNISQNENESVSSESDIRPHFFVISNAKRYLE